MVGLVVEEEARRNSYLYTDIEASMNPHATFFLVVISAAQILQYFCVHVEMIHFQEIAQVMVSFALR